MAKFLAHLLFFLACGLLISTDTSAAVMGAMDYRLKISRSDAIFVAKVEDRRAAGADIHLVVSRAVKGDLSSPIIIPVREWGNMAPVSGIDIMVYLRADGSSYKIVDMNSPFTPVFGNGPAGSDLASLSTEERVAAELAHSLATLDGASSAAVTLRSDRIRLTNDLATLTSGRTWLTQLYRGASPAAQLVYLSGILRTGDLSPLSARLDQILKTPRTFDMEAGEVGAALLDVNQRIDNAVAARLLTASHALVRTAGAVALHHHGDEPSLAAVVKFGLRDPDPYVRYLAVRTLTRVVSEQNPPTEAQFRAQESGYLNHWRAWARRRGLDTGGKPSPSAKPT